jgi:hypothetical protein
MFLALAFLVVAAPVVSRCSALKVPTVRLVKGRRLSSFSAADNWKASLGADGGSDLAQVEAADIALPRNESSWWATLVSLLKVSTPAHGLVALTVTTVRGISEHLSDSSSQQFSPAGNPLRC